MVPSRSATRKYSALSIEAPQSGRIERQDGGAGGVVQGKDGIQLVLAHVADDNRHSVTPCLTCLIARRGQRVAGDGLSHARPDMRGRLRGRRGP